MEEIKQEKYLPVIVTVSSQIIAIEDRLDTIKHGFTIGKISRKKYVKELEIARHDFYLLLGQKPTPIERSLIKKSSTQCYELLEKHQKSKWQTVGKIGFGIISIGISIALGVQL